ncbi:MULTISPECIES: hypothetical protein [Kitasatospora]|uniref:Uncharacterized protein n=1 Tax=Kitasatospora setae (strain ATCC 33774 / DSM 43861 / JCM 3304 / KCC A-0304 / NBRC 14216 / KM-6054) TaxID=452652 RepID=E4N956_KITSK|nr:MULTISPECIES: hypothetical protein [Kitasatospora]BAJ27737.1 hypothetical protein KSE_19130 [Kitasatospora setae KM-6054]
MDEDFDAAELWPVEPSLEVEELLVAAPDSLHHAVLAVQLRLMRDPWDPASASIGRDPHSRDIPLEGHAALLEYEIVPGPHRHVVITAVQWWHTDIEGGNPF